MQFGGDLHAALDEINVDIFQFSEKWNWKWTVYHEEHFFRKLPATNVSFAPKYVHLQGFFLKFK